MELDRNRESRNGNWPNCIFQMNCIYGQMQESGFDYATMQLGESAKQRSDSRSSTSCAFYNIRPRIQARNIR